MEGEKGKPNKRKNGDESVERSEKTLSSAFKRSKGFGDETPKMA